MPEGLSCPCRMNLRLPKSTGRSGTPHHGQTNTSGCWQQPLTARSEKQSSVKGSTTGARRGFSLRVSQGCLGPAAAAQVCPISGSTASSSLWPHAKPTFHQVFFHPSVVGKWVALFRQYKMSIEMVSFSISTQSFQGFQGALTFLCVEQVTFSKQL